MDPTILLIAEQAAEIIGQKTRRLVQVMSVAKDAEGCTVTLHVGDAVRPLLEANKGERLTEQSESI